MTSNFAKKENHFIHRVGWLRASVLGANDGIVSTASLIIGVAEASTSQSAVLIAGIAALVAGSMSMAAGEYVSVSSQADTEKSDLDTERQALKDYPKEELEELAAIYETRGLDKDLALQVATQLTKHDALASHARDELGMSDMSSARPVQAAFASAVSFAIGAALPLMAVLVLSMEHLTWGVAGVSLLSLIVLGYISASVGGASKRRAIIRILFWGIAAMLITGVIGRLFGTVL